MPYLGRGRRSQCMFLPAYSVCAAHMRDENTAFRSFSLPERTKSSDIYFYQITGPESWKDRMWWRLTAKTDIYSGDFIDKGHILGKRKSEVQAHWVRDRNNKKCCTVAGRRYQLYGIEGIMKNLSVNKIEESKPNANKHLEYLRHVFKTPGTASLLKVESWITSRSRPQIQFSLAIFAERRKIKVSKW